MSIGAMNFQLSISNFQSMATNERIFNLEERTTVFAEKVITFCRTIKPDAVNQRIISQLVGASGSIGANYGEAVEAESKKDFIHKISISKKETKETRHWLRLLTAAHPEKKEELLPFRKEAHELLLIFAKIVRSSRANRPIENSIV
ncbi:MAG: four helix bundle protein [bacterium]|nr:four helix bundle protein [bacterium]